MISKIKKIALTLALAGIVGSTLSPAASFAKSMPRAPGVETGVATEQIRHRRWHRRRWHHRRRSWHHRRRSWHRRHRSWRPRRCYRYLRRYRITHRRHWLRRYRRCMRRR